MLQPVLIVGQNNLVFLDNLPQVDQGVAHAAQGGVDANSGTFAYLLEAHVFVNSHDQNFTLVVGEFVNQQSQVAVDLVFDQLALHVQFVVSDN